MKDGYWVEPKADGLVTPLAALLGAQQVEHWVDGSVAWKAVKTVGDSVALKVMHSVLMKAEYSVEKTVQWVFLSAQPLVGSV